jgi:hypothetical protein
MGESRLNAPTMLGNTVHTLMFRSSPVTYRISWRRFESLSHLITPGERHEG